MKAETIYTDITVIGGGLAGVCAAVAAARLGRTVALVQNRPVLGGNSSSEVRVWVCGATSHDVNRYARETGIMGEMFVENQYRNPEGNPYLWDLIVLETVLAEKNIRLFLNTDVHEVEVAELVASRETEGDDCDNGRIASVTGWMMGSERRIRFIGEMFLDCTGDGLIGFLAGANYRIGREARHEFNEDWAPEVADDITLGSTILFYTKDAGQPVKYIPPSFAKDITQTSIPVRRVIRSGDSGCHYWWIEWGGELDTVHENERIRDELWSVIYGIWDYIKNSGKFEADNMTLEWVGSIPGKREYRRFVGDYMLNQNDVIGQTPFEDRIAFGGWSIDLHPPQGMYAQASGSKHYHADGIYHIPFRSLYSNNVENLMFAGRNISASHVAFGTTRVMATCAVMGEAAGTGAALVVQHGVTPRELGRRHLTELQETLLRQDASVIGLRSRDSLNKARSATVTASSVQRSISVEEPAEAYPLINAVGILFPVTNRLDRLSLLLDSAEATELTVTLYGTGRSENYIPAEQLESSTVKVAPGERQWVAFPFQYETQEPLNLFAVVEANEAVMLYTSGEPFFGMLSFEKKVNDSSDFSEFMDTQLTMIWTMKRLIRKPFCAIVEPATEAYAAESVVNGYIRPYGGPQLWMSERLREGAQEWVSLAWDEPIALSEIQLIFNDDVNQDLINLHHFRTPFDVMPELVRDYRVEVCMGGEWTVLLREKDNRKRNRVHRLEQPVAAEQMRVVVEATAGSKHAQIVEIRAYE
ncbi:FAD-dependent oxidoreductase [Paenibacillus agaridevorans]|uniref:FAD-dependent oxidoreductase n=1 Tax=Paenibacillus agaridevorans TaxID=171404 RepID=UPI001BE424A6|nr:FAD-dependent oxidoreductase [Paenibacillus agaridevorans]